MNSLSQSKNEDIEAIVIVPPKARQKMLQKALAELGTKDQIDEKVESIGSSINEL